MKLLRPLLFCLVFMFGEGLSAQENNIRKEFQQKGDLTEAIFYHENGQVAQKGTYKNGKLHGEWIAFDIEGNKIALGKYSDGVKTGKWFFWNDDRLSEVDFHRNTIASVTHWKSKKGQVIK